MRYANRAATMVDERIVCPEGNFKNGAIVYGCPYAADIHSADGA